MNNTTETAAELRRHARKLPKPSGDVATVMCAAAKELDQLHAEVDLLTHKVITCGVAATNQDAGLTLTGAYAEKWGSAQAHQVRELRRARDAAESELHTESAARQTDLARYVAACRAVALKMRASYKRSPSQYMEGLCEGVDECLDAIQGLA